jgi:hypothetical protein
MLTDWAAYSLFRIRQFNLSFEKQRPLSLRFRNEFHTVLKLGLCLFLGNQIEILIITRLTDIKGTMSDPAEFPVKNSASDKISVKIRYDPAVFPAVQSDQRRSRRLG